MRKSLRKVAATLSALTLALAVTATAVPTDVSAATSKAGKKAALTQTALIMHTSEYRRPVHGSSVMSGIPIHLVSMVRT